MTWEQDEEIQRINDSWPDSTRSEQAEKMGFGIDRSIDEIIDGFIEDDMQAQLRILA